MNNWDHHLLRKSFQDFFIDRGHHLVPSSSILPLSNDNSILFVNAGMVQFKEYFLDNKSAKFDKIISIQKCVRAGGKHNDINNVGFTKRHHTFFEMLGNFSFGSVDKTLAIELIWKFLTEKLKIPKELLIVTVHNSDSEALEIWKKHVSIDRIGVLEENFWRMGNTGPCGPCTEIHYSLIGPKFDKNDFYKDQENFLELWNIVFMQFYESSEGTSKLENLCVDTGGGLERILSVLQGKDNNFDTDLFTSIINLIRSKYLPDAEEFILRIAADHVRTACIVISDGVLPDNEGRGFVIRKMIRRAVRFYEPYAKEPFLYKLVAEVKNIFQGIYNIKSEIVQNILKKEEEQYLHILQEAPKLVKQMIQEKTRLSGEDLFFLYDTYGIPLEVSSKILEDHSLFLDEKDKAVFDSLMNRQRSKANEDLTIPDFDFSFTGYDSFSEKTQVVCLLDEKNQPVETMEVDAENSATGFLVVKVTPFYAESGGQVGDTGIGTGENFNLTITNTKKHKLSLGEIHIHHIILNKGVIRIGDSIEMTVDQSRRADVMRHHSAAHLLGHVIEQMKGFCEQRGSLVNENFARLDLYCDDLTEKDIPQIEEQVNNLISMNLDSSILYLSPEEAERKGAKKLPGVQYPSIVRTITFDGTATELCCGTHVKNTAEIGPLMIRSIQSIGKDTKRIEAVVGFKLVKDLKNIIRTVTDKLNCRSDRIIQKIDELIKSKKSEGKAQLTEVSSEQIGNHNIILYKGEADQCLAGILEQKAVGKDTSIVLNIDTGTIIIKSHSDRALALWNSIDQWDKKGGGYPNFLRGKIIFNDKGYTEMVNFIKTTLNSME